jgi:hypothetical protein
MLILKENVADKKKWSFFKITKSVNYFWSDMKDAKTAHCSQQNQDCSNAHLRSSRSIDPLLSLPWLLLQTAYSPRSPLHPL